MTRGWVAFLLAYGVAIGADACSFAGLEHEVKFSPESSTLAASEVRTLVDWYLQKRDGPQGILEVAVYGLSQTGNPASARLSRDRARVVTELVRSLSKDLSVPLSTYVDAIKTPRQEAFETVVVSTQPTCLKTQSCCGRPIQ